VYSDPGVNVLTASSHASRRHPQPQFTHHGCSFAQLCHGVVAPAVYGYGCMCWCWCALPLHTPLPFVSELSKSPPDGMSVGLHDDNLFDWEVMIVGPVGTP